MTLEPLELTGDGLLVQIPVDGLLHVYESQNPFGVKYIRKILDEANGPAGLSEGVVNPARIEAKIDDTECTVWFSPNPDLPENPRARAMVAEVFGWHMVFHGSVCIVGLNEKQAEILVGGGIGLLP